MNISLISPSGAFDSDLLESNLKSLESENLSFHPIPLIIEGSWPYTSSSARSRATQLETALCGEDDLIWAIRGGYGSQETLCYIDWDKVARHRPKVLIGFSDISALQAALWKKLGWRSLHAPMPGTSSWCKTHKKAIDLVDALSKSRSLEIRVRLNQNDDEKQPIKGKLLGGCFSVLSQLIGTKWLPDLRGAIIFFEDVNEHPARLLRYFEQWCQAGLLQDASAIIFGELLGCERLTDDISTSDILLQLKRRCPIPFFSTDEFGHGSQNVPIGVGFYGTIYNNELIWNLGECYE